MKCFITLQWEAAPWQLLGVLGIVIASDLLGNYWSISVLGQEDAAQGLSASAIVFSIAFSIVLREQGFGVALLLSMPSGSLRVRVMKGPSWSKK